MTEFHFVRTIRSWGGNSFCVCIPKDFRQYFKIGNFVKVVIQGKELYFIGKIRRANATQDYVRIPPDLRGVFKIGTIVNVFNIKQPNKISD